MGVLDERQTCAHGRAAERARLRFLYPCGRVGCDEECHQYCGGSEAACNAAAISEWGQIACC